MAAGISSSLLAEKPRLRLPLNCIDVVDRAAIRLVKKAILNPLLILSFIVVDYVCFAFEIL